MTFLRMKLMKPMRCLFSAALLATWLGGIPACAQAEQIVMTATDPRPATSFTVSYSAQCPGVGYEIRFLKQSAQVQFIVRDGGERIFDISGTRFGQTFLHKHLYGDFDMVCGRGLVLHFLGVQLQRTGQPKLMRYYFSIENNGTVIHEEGPVEEDVDEIDRLIDR
jgi:hypothetical protein